MKNKAENHARIANRYLLSRKHFCECTVSVSPLRSHSRTATIQNRATPETLLYSAYSGQKLLRLTVSLWTVDIYCMFD